MILVAAVGIKLVLVFTGRFPFNSDEAVVGLMARHILQGERPVFFYGQGYMGSLDAFLVAGAFRLFGEQVWVIRLVQVLLYSGVIGTTYGLGERIFGSARVGRVAAGLMAVPVVGVTLYTTVSLGGYGEALLLGNLMLLGALRIAKYVERNQAGDPSNVERATRLPRKAAWMAAAWGLLAGLGVWALALTLLYAVPAAAYVGWKLAQRGQAERKRIGLRLVLAAMAGFALGALPLWIYMAGNGLAKTAFEYGGGAVAVSHMPYLAQVGTHLVSLILLGGTAVLGMRPPWEVRWLMLPLIPFVLLFWGMVVVLTRRRLRRHPEESAAVWMLLGVMILLAAAFILTPFGIDPSGRYFLPLAVPMALLAARALLDLHLPKAGWRWAILGGLLAFNAGGTLQCALRLPPGLTTQFDRTTVIDHHYDAELIAFLKENGETRGYSTYWVSFPLAFLSQEELLFVPRLPYHQDLRYTARDDRYPPYSEAVAASPRAAYITANNPALDDALQAAYRQAGVDWQEQRIGDYRVYYRLSRAVSPDGLGLKFVTEP